MSLKTAAAPYAVDSGEQTPIAGMPAPTIPGSEPVRTGGPDGEVEWSGDMAEVMAPPGGVVVSDVPADTDDEIEYEVEAVGGGRYAAVPVDEPRPRQPVDREVSGGELGISPGRDDAAHDRSRAEASERVDAAAADKRREEIASELATVKHNLGLAEAGHKYNTLNAKVKRLSRRGRL